DQSFDRLLRASTMTSLVDLVVVMIVDPAQALHRDSPVKPRIEPGAIMNCGTLETINHSIGEVSKRCGGDFRLESLDTSGMSATEALGHVKDIVRRLRPARGPLRRTT